MCPLLWIALLSMKNLVLLSIRIFKNLYFMDINLIIFDEITVFLVCFLSSPFVEEFYVLKKNDLIFKIFFVISRGKCRELRFTEIKNFIIYCYSLYNFQSLFTSHLGHHVVSHQVNKCRTHFTQFLPHSKSHFPTANTTHAQVWPMHTKGACLGGKPLTRFIQPSKRKSKDRLLRS